MCVSRIDLNLTASKDNMYLISFMAEQETFSKYSTLAQQLTIQSRRTATAIYVETGWQQPMSYLDRSIAPDSPSLDPPN